ncbi:MAG: [protein-PII] uridylyltransferase [Pseudomonadales bacterium]
MTSDNLNVIQAKLVKELTGSRQIIPAFKQAIVDCKQDLENRFREGADVSELMLNHAAFIDQILSLAWNRFEWDENLTSWRKSRVSLVAVGGFGRGELHPNSDIDLLILLERNSYDKHRENIQSFLTLLWDIGLEVGQSVRSVKECKVQAAVDVTIITSLLEARTIVGDPELFNKVHALISPNKVWSKKKFFLAKLEERKDRHRKSNHTEYSLEPNVKSSPGGLRDIQTVMWIAKRQFGRVESFDDLVDREFLTATERDVLGAGERLLWRIRYALHLVAGRDENRLLFEHQRTLAELFGYADGDQLAVEQFMQSYYRTAMTVNATCDILLQYFDEEIIKKKNHDNITPINERFQIRNNYIEVTRQDVFKMHPPALMEIFEIMGGNNQIEGVRVETIREITSSLDLIDENFRAADEVTKTFLSILAHSNHLYSQLRLMERYGILAAYLPEFGRIIGQMQFDLFHIYTVDAHTLQVVRNMRRFRYKNQEQRFPIAAHIYPRLPKLELLFISGLYHDIAKGLGGDHSQLGIDIARDFCQRHKLGTWDTNLVCWLVENHLVMSSTSQKKDISDPDVIREFAMLVQDQVRLDYIYALTVADINATNPTLWTSWRASLMRQLYLETKRALRHGLENYVDRAEYISETQNHAIERLSEHDVTKEETLEIWGTVDDEYFVRESVADIVWHTQAIKHHNLDDGPLVILRDTEPRREGEGATEIFLYTQGTQRVFANAVSCIDKLGLDIVDARIASGSSDLIFDTFIVLEENGKAVGPLTHRQNRIKSLLTEELLKEEDEQAPKIRRTPRQLKNFDFKTEVTLSYDRDKDLTVLEIICPDRPGLLTIIAEVLAEFDISLQGAKITTLGEKVEDLFYLPGNKVDTESLAQRLRQELDGHVELSKSVVA